MMPRPASVVKICGLTRPKDVHACVEAGVGAVGFVLASGPRRLSVEQVKRLVEELKRSRRRAGGERERVQGGIDASSPRAVGVFASASLEEMVSVPGRQDWRCCSCTERNSRTMWSAYLGCCPMSG